MATDFPKFLIKLEKSYVSIVNGKKVPPTKLSTLKNEAVKYKDEKIHDSYSNKEYQIPDFMKHVDTMVGGKVEIGNVKTEPRSVKMETKINVSRPDVGVSESKLAVEKLAVKKKKASPKKK